MVAIRIGNNVELFWDIKFTDSETHLPLDGKTVLFEMIVKGQRIEVTDFDLIEGRIHWYFLGKDQGELGIYDLRLVVSPGEEDQIIYDKEGAFRLVRHSWEADQESDAEVQYITIELESEIGKIIDDRYISSKIARTAELEALREDTEAKDEQQDTAIGQNADAIETLAENTYTKREIDSKNDLQDTAIGQNADAIETLAENTYSKREVDSKNDQQDTAIGHNADAITALQERVVLISDVEYAILEEEGLVDPEKIYMVYEQEESQEGT